MKTSHQKIDHHGFTALESLIMLVLLAALAMTGLAVYQKKSTQAPAVEIQDPVSAKLHNDGGEPRKAMSDSHLDVPAISTDN